MKRFGSIYLITNKLTGTKYVGQTTNLVSGRFNEHCRDRRSSRYLSSAIQKHGQDNFAVEELMVCFDENSLNEMETHFITQLNTLHPNGYNLSLGGHQRGTISQLTRQKMSQCKLGKKVNRARKWSEFSRLNKSRAQNGKSIVAENVVTGEKKHYDFINQAEKDGFQNGSIYKVLKGERKTVKGHTFYYYDANQSGSEEGKNSSHAQRIEIEAAKKAG